ncbi:MAG: hypothetical protein EXX96DRAFT_239123 [Benjaminiella poitrasii]|nr:MAG: hypothetical protein EXX96DRAFT_239123 [Benjaminiella poitrasii]
MLYQPCSKKDTDTMNILYLSRSRRKIWTTDFSINQDPVRAAEVANKHKEQLYVISPKTTIMTFSQDNRLVYIIDLSSSLATVGNTQADILLSEVFQTLKNSLEGLVQPFSMQISPTQKAIIQPSLRLTVMADCSQFASNVNVIRMLVEHPTMRVFMQNVIITANNINSIIRKLRSEFLAFQEDTVQFRKFIKKNRANMGYNLDVGSDVTSSNDVGVFDSTSFPRQQSTKPFSSAPDNNNKQISSQSKSTKGTPQLSATSINLESQQSKDTSFYSSTSKKEVWGIGKSGANLSRILHAGHFALKLLPQEGRAQLILITDGAMKSNVHDNTFVRQFAEEDITCHIIQIGYSSSFIPGRNFGFVPDTEILQFLARATNGTFMYSEACLTKSHTNILMYHDDEANSPTSATTATSATTVLSNLSQLRPYAVVQLVDFDKAKHIKTPNLFHRHFLFRETVLTRHHHSELRLQTEKDSQGQLNRRDLSGNNLMESAHDSTLYRFNFPWDPYARAPEGELRLLKYREYILPAEFSHIIAARAREGFMVQSVTFDDGTGSKHVDAGLRDLEAPDLTTIRKERIQIVMVLRWQPNVLIEYRIRATWLPTIIGNTANSYKSENILMSSNIFSRGKAPRAEIFVRTDASFAHMLQNWDVFRRRAQMMGVVTGSIFLGDSYTAPIYSKIEKLKSYLVDIFEGDEVLKTVIGFPNKYWINMMPTGNSESNTPSLSTSCRSESTRGNAFMSERPSMTQQKVAYIDAFKDLWDRFNASEARARTRCWYDPGSIDLLVGNVSPYMTPRLMSSYNQEFVSNVEDDILIMVNNIKTVMEGWSDFVSEDGTYVRMMHKLISSPAVTVDEQMKDYFSLSLTYPPSFCELRVRHEYGRLVTLRLLFFNVEVVARKRAIEYLIQLLKTDNRTSATYNMICERPFSQLLMRDPKHFNVSSSSKQVDSTNKNQNRSETWYLPVAMWLTSEYIVRDYLKRMTWSWQTDNSQDSFHKENTMMPIHDLAFQFLCQARLDQGYQLVSPRPDSTHFYQEIELPGREGKETALCAIQYFVWKDSSTGQITTELWMEPSGSFDYDQYKLVKRWTFEPDKKTISQLVTFDQMHAVGRSRSIGDFKSKSKGFYAKTGAPDEDTAIMPLHQLFNVASVLTSNKFIVSSFQPPHYEMALLPHSQPHNHQIKLKALVTPTIEDNHQDSVEPPASPAHAVRSNRNLAYSKAHHRYLRRHGNTPVSIDSSVTDSSPCPTDSHTKLFSFRPDSLLNKNKGVIAKLDVVLQNYALLHYFVEQSLEYISNGEILMSHHDVGTAFWQDLRSALEAATDDSRLSSTCLIPDLRRTRCFVKVFDPRSFVVILLPNLESISTGLLKLQEDDESNSVSKVEKCRFLDIFMFECVRQKPMKPTKNELLFSSPLEESNRIRIENIDEDTDTISIKPINYLIHESDGLGVMLRPQLFEGEYSCCQAGAQLTDRILRVAQDVTRFYSRSFLKSFYTCLMRGFMVDDKDLSKVLEVCNESSMEIDITEFVNTMSMQKNESMESETQETEIQGKFNSIFHQYFEFVQTKNGTNSNLFYYKPPFTRHEKNDPRQKNMSEDDKVSFIVDLVAHSQAPLLIRLNAAYRTTTYADNSTPPEIIIPINSLPTSYSGHTINGEQFNLKEESDMLDESFPLRTGNTRVFLQIVCLNIPRSDLDDCDFMENLYTYNLDFLIQSMQSQPECFSSLSQDQKVALAETESRVNWLLKEETIHGLLKAPVITLLTLKYVEQQLSSPCPFVTYQTSLTIPFQFVKNFTESRLIFMDELEKDSCCQKNGKYRLKRIENYFYVCQDSVFNMGDEVSYSNSGSPVVPEHSPSTSELDHFSTNHSTTEDEFCDGLGISITNTVKTENNNNETKLEENATVPFDKRPLYWLILIPYEKHIQVYFYSKFQLLGPGFNILKLLKEKLKIIQERTNQLALLNYLQESRICSKYLEAPSGNGLDTISSDEDESEEDRETEEIQDIFNTTDSSTETNKFIPGQFSCPLVFTKRFSLHWRLQPNIALKFLTTDVLRLFTVINRPNMFVIERDGSIVYCKILEESFDNEEEGSPNTLCGSPVQTLSGKNTEDDLQTLVGVNASETTPKRELSRISSTSPRPRTASGTRSSSSHDKRELVLEVYGIDLPSWVEKEFVNMIENRLVSQITLNEIQQFFSRNSVTKPTAADVDFILPTSKPPTLREMLRVPNLVNSPYLLLQYFKQSLIADNIRPLTGPYVRRSVSSYYDRMFSNYEMGGIQNASKRQLKR